MMLDNLIRMHRELTGVDAGVSGAFSAGQTLSLPNFPLAHPGRAFLFPCWPPLGPSF